jgi:spore coat polysaccharide biosynthesis protein SpsF
MILAILQARLSSTRLPKKVLKPLLGEPMILRQIERLQRSKQIDKLVVATSNELSDDPIESLCRKNNIQCFRGSLDNVLDRYYQAAIIDNPDYIVRLTADCPLADPNVIDNVISFYMAGNYDYASNTLSPTFPDGLDIEVFKFSCLEQAWKEARLSSEHEHATPYIYNNPLKFKLGNYVNTTDLSHLRWTVDEPEDFEFVTKVYESLYPINSEFSMDDILDLLSKQPDLMKINNMFARNEGYQKSLDEDFIVK